MTRLKTLAAAAAAVLIFASPVAFAEMANGSYSRHFMSSEVPLWDISGSYSDSDIGIGSSMDFILSEDPSGALTGAGTFDYDDGILILNGPLTVTGKMKGGGGTVTRVSMKILISGTGTFFSDGVTFTATANVNHEIDSAAGELVLTSGRVNLKLQDILTGRKGSLSDKLDPGSTIDLPIDSTGEWDLTLNLVPVPDETKYDDITSTASVDTSTGGTADLIAKGNYSSKTDMSKITLKRTRGNLNLLISTVPALFVHSVKGKLYGQKVNFIAP